MFRFRALGHLLLFATLITASSVKAQITDYDKLKNDKELSTTLLTDSQNERLKTQYSDYYAESLFKILTDSLDEFNSRQRACDLGLTEVLDDQLQSKHIDQKFYKEYFGILRAHNKIDDILYNILNKAMELHLNLKKAASSPIRVDRRLFLGTPKVLKRNNVKKLYSSFQSWPDEDTLCSLGAYYTLADKASNSKGKISKRGLKILNTKAYEDGEISAQTYMKLQVLAESESLEWPIYIGAYQDKIKDAKNVMQYTDPLPITEEMDLFASEHIKRRKNLTRRKSLYYKYNATQIVMLAQVIEKVSMRMGVDPTVETSTPEIITNYVMRRDGSETSFTESYELSPSEQFEFARKRLRMDLMELASSKTFTGVKVTYEDVIMAALETGYISHHDIEYVIRYDDLWNPDLSPWKKYKEYVTSFVSTAAFYLPPPWNVVGAVGLVFINTKLSSKRGHESHENPANIFN